MTWQDGFIERGRGERQAEEGKETEEAFHGAPILSLVVPGLGRPILPCPALLVNLASSRSGKNTEALIAREAERLRSCEDLIGLLEQPAPE